MAKTRVRWAFCAADMTRNGKIDHVDAELAEVFAREGRLSIEPAEAVADVDVPVADDTAPVKATAKSKP